MSRTKKKPIIAAILSLLMPGLGFAYNDYYRFASIITIIPITIEMLIGYTGFMRNFLWLVLITLGEIFVRIFSLVFNIELSQKLQGQKANRTVRRSLYIGIILINILSTSLIELFPTATFSVESAVMEPSVEKEEWIMIDKDPAKLKSLIPGDVVAFYPPRNSIFHDTTVKHLSRVIASEGQIVEIREGIVYVNGERSLPQLLTKRLSSKIKPSSYRDANIQPLAAGNADWYGPVTVPANSYFVMGDLRDDAIDSRYYGCVDKNSIMGKALYVYWSNDWYRIGKNIE